MCSNTSPTLYGAAYSVYVRVARLALVKKGVAYDLVEVDIFGGAVPDWYARLYPFGRILAFAHDEFRLHLAPRARRRGGGLTMSATSPARAVRGPRAGPGMPD